MSSAVFIAHLVAVASSANDFLPCRPGLTIEYRWVGADGEPSASTRTDRVDHQQGRLCFVHRTSVDADGRTEAVYVLEHLADRILEAGWQGAMTAFRAPLLTDPIRDGKRWRFNRMDYRLRWIMDGHRTPAGQFGPVVQIVAESDPRGRFWAARFYAYRVGLIEDRRPEGAWVAVRVRGTGAR